MTGRNVWDTTPEEEPEIEMNDILDGDGALIRVDIAVDVPEEVAVRALERRIERLQVEQQEFYSVTRQHQMDRLRREIRTRGETGG